MSDKRGIEIKDLTKVFGSRTAVDNISLDIKDGEMFALLGINGAGKTTTIKMLTALSIPTSGDALLNGYSVVNSPDKVKEIVNVSPQETAVAGNLTVRENLEFIAGVYDVKDRRRINEIISEFKFDEIINQRAKTLSGGWQRRLSIAMALISDPEILFLDEPTLGLDVIARRELWKIIKGLKGHKTIILTTHYMEEAADADYVVILDSGRIVAEGTPLELKNAYTGDFITLYGIDETEASKLGMPYEKLRGAVRIAVPNTAAATKLITENPQLFTDYEIVKGKMDDVFLAVTGRKLTGGEDK